MPEKDTYRRFEIHSKCITSNCYPPAAQDCYLPIWIVKITSLVLFSQKPLQLLRLFTVVRIIIFAVI